MEETENSKKTKCLPSSIKDECFYAWASTVTQQPLMYYGLHFKGKPSREIMESALLASLEIHGKLRCVLTREPSFWKKWFRFRWEPLDVDVSNILRFISASEHKIELDREAHYYRDLILKHSMDVTKEPGIRMLQISRDDESLLLLAFHHAATDGRGAINFVETFIAEYNAIYFKKESPKKESRQHTSPRMSLWGQGLDAAKSFLYTVQHQYCALKEPLIKVAPKTQEHDSRDPLVIALELKPEEFEKVLARAKKKSVRFAALLLAGVYLTIRKWNSRCGDDTSGRISFFASVGVLRGDPKSVGNITSGMIIDFLTRDNTDKGQILTTIAKAQDAFVKYGDIYGFLSICNLMPIRFRLLALKRALRRLQFEHNRRFPTMRVANLGMLDVVNFSQNDKAILGNMRPQNIILSPANVNEVPFLLFHTYQKSLHAYLVVFKSAFSEESGKEFLALLVQELLDF